MTPVDRAALILEQVTSGAACVACSMAETAAVEGAAAEKSVLRPPSAPMASYGGAELGLEVAGGHRPGSSNT